MRAHTGVAGVKALAATCLLLAVGVLGGCSADRMQPLDTSAGYPAGLRLFSAPPGRADCSRIDLAGLRKVAGADQPQPRALLQQSKTDTSIKWASCAGLAPADPAASPSPSAGADGAAASPSPSTDSTDVSGRQVVWEVAWATSERATLPFNRANPKAGDRDYHMLTRTTAVGDAKADVMLAVHAEDHRTQVWVTVFDPRTGRDGAECGIGGVPGDQADAAVRWCEQAIVSQLLKVPAPVPTAQLPA